MKKIYTLLTVFTLVVCFNILNAKPKNRIETSPPNSLSNLKSLSIDLNANYNRLLNNNHFIVNQSDNLVYFETENLQFRFSKTNHSSTLLTSLKDKNHKISICHIPPGNPQNAHVIRVSIAALAAHLAHGDNFDLENCNSNTHENENNEIDDNYPNYNKKHHKHNDESEGDDSEDSNSSSTGSNVITPNPCISYAR